MHKLYEFAGGRKVFLTYLATALMVGYALLVRPDFLSFAGAIGTALLGGAFAVAYEDRARPS